jgi:hypothetical protein
MGNKEERGFSMNISPILALIFCYIAYKYVLNPRRKKIILANIIRKNNIFSLDFISQPEYEGERRNLTCKQNKVNS